jgi:LysR family transcriptional regulator, benzoate and cis,cis-muconate-responsive activator of ben and cat genes
MNLQRFRYFAMVVAEGSFSRAAEKLHMAQPPLSRQIQQLEDEIGAQLLHRGRPLTLTEAGRYFYEQIRQVLNRVEDVRSMTRKIARGSVKQFSIGFVASTLYESLPELIRRFRLIVSDVEVALLEMTTLEQMAALRDGRIDVGFGRLRFDDPAITRIVMREEPIAAALPQGHAAAARAAPLTLRDLASEPLIIYPSAPRPSYADQVLSFYRDNGIEPQVAFEVRELQTALGLVAAAAGICLVPHSVRKLGRADIVFVDLNEPRLTSPIIMSFRTSDVSEPLSHFRSLVSEFDTWKAPYDETRQPKLVVEPRETPKPNTPPALP